MGEKRLLTIVHYFRLGEYNEIMIRAVWDSKSSGSFDADFDCYLAEALVSQGHAFGNLEETLVRYNVSTLNALAQKQQERLHAMPKLEKLYYEIEMPLAATLRKMEQKGILLDTKQLTQVGQHLDRSI